jgi:hypothetical protein
MPTIKLVESIDSQTIDSRSIFLQSLVIDRTVRRPNLIFLRRQIDRL